MTPIDSGSNGPCDANAQTGCGSGQKCSISLTDGTVSNAGKGNPMIHVWPVRGGR